MANQSPTPALKINDFLGLFDDIWGGPGPGFRAGVKDIYICIFLIDSNPSNIFYHRCSAFLVMQIMLWGAFALHVGRVAVVPGLSGQMQILMFSDADYTWGHMYKIPYV